MKPADQIGSYVTALTLTGLPYAAGKLMGKAPQPVLRQFEIWGRAGKSGLPRVVRTYWKAIAPLGINRPSLPGVPILELILYGQMSDVDVARDAHQAVTLGAKRAMHVAGKPTPVDPVVDQMVLEMGTAIKQFWRLYAHTCGKAREQVVNGDLGSAVICVRRNEAQILELIDEIETKARAIVGLVGRTSTAGVDQVLPQLLTPDEYVQPDLEHLVVSQTAVDQAAPSAAGLAPDTQPQSPGFIESQVHGFPVAPRPEQTAIQTSFSQHDEVDEAAARFATGRIEPITKPEEAPEPDLTPSSAEPSEPSAPYPSGFNEPVEDVEEGKESGAWLGVVFVLLSVALACAVVWYFMFGSPF